MTVMNDLALQRDDSDDSDDSFSDAQDDSDDSERLVLRCAEVG